MTELEQHLADLRVSYAAIKREDEQRKQITESAAYLALQEQMTAMIAGVSDSREEYEMDRDAVLKAVNAEKITDVPGFVLKTRAKRSVDTNAVLHAMDGDIDNLMIVATVTQKSLETFIKDNPTYKRDLRSCIRDEGISVVDIMPS
ncbi:MAG: hypothetical protein JWP89_2592 [Schlesneria sp.]|nr:hypothetical protein [Schlesneria sp.]